MIGYIVVGTGVPDGPLQTVRTNEICLLQRRCLITLVGIGGLAAARSHLGSDSRLRLSFTTSVPLRYLDGPLQTVRIAENFVKWTVEDAGPYNFCAVCLEHALPFAISV